MGSPCLQEDGGHVHLAFPGRDVQGRVPVRGGRVRVRHVLEQQLHDLRLAQARSDVQRRLFLLQPKAGQRSVSRQPNATCSSYNSRQVRGQCLGSPNASTVIYIMVSFFWEPLGRRKFLLP